MLFTLGLLAAILTASVGSSPAPIANDVAPTPLPRTQPLFTASGKTPIVLPAVFDRRVLVNATIGGHQMWLHLDSGTSNLVLGGDDAKAIGATVDPATRYTQPFAVSIGAVSAQARFQVAPSYGFVDNGRRISGLIGGPFFHANIVTIDFPNSRVIFYPPGTFTPPKGVPPTPIELFANTPTIAATVGTEGGRFLIDTGAGVSELSGDFVKKLRLGLYQGNVVTEGGGARTEGAYIGPDLSFAGFNVHRPIFVVATDPRVPFAGIVGRDILSNFSLTFDYADQVVYIAH